MGRRGTRRTVAAVLLVASALAGTAATGTSVGATDYEDPFFLDWPSFLPSAPAEYELSSEDDCKNGQVQCVDKVIRQMTKRYNALACDHDSMFAFTHLLTTEEYREAVEDPDFFTDNAFVNHQDAVFADYYFEAFDDWHAGRTEEVPASWRIAFHAGENQEVTGMGNVFLGMNAHVNRDLPFVLEAIGLVKPDGTSRKVDHDRVNDFLNAVNQYLLVEAAKVLDPTVDDGDVPGISVDNSVTVQALVAWREQAWRNAERLVNASSSAERDRIAAEIEQAAALEALNIRTTFRYDGLLSTRDPRNAFCATHFSSR